MQKNAFTTKSYEVIYDRIDPHADPTVSIVIPYFNAGEFIEETLASVSDQSYRSYEIIIVDDGSSDSQSKAKVEQLQIANTKIIRQANQGPSAARNLAISLSSGRLILPLDADDLLHPDYLSHCVPALLENVEVGIVTTEVRRFGNRSKPFDLPDPTEENMIFGNTLVITSLFRKSHWQQFGGFKNEMIYGLEDYEFWINFLEAGLKIKRIPIELFYYRHHKSSFLQSITRQDDKHDAMMELIFELHPAFFSRNVASIYYAWLKERRKVKRLNRSFGLPLPGRRKLRFNVVEK